MSTQVPARVAVITVLMMPPVEVNQNWHGSWRRRAKAVAEFRRQAGLATRAALSDPAAGLSRYCGWDFPDQGGVVMDFEIAWAGRRKRMDDGNAKAALKALVDGIADVLFLGDDSHVTIGELRQVRGDGTVTVTLHVADERGGR